MCAGRAGRAAATRPSTRGAVRRQVRDGHEVRFLARSPLLDPAAAPGFADELVATATLLLTAARARLRGPLGGQVPCAEAAAAAAGACGARAALWPLSEGTLLAQLLAAAAGDAGLARLAALLHLALEALPELAAAASLPPAAGREVRPAGRARPPGLARTRCEHARGCQHHVKWLGKDNKMLGACGPCAARWDAPDGGVSRWLRLATRPPAGPTAGSTRARLPSPRGCPRRTGLRARRAGAQALARPTRAPALGAAAPPRRGSGSACQQRQPVRAGPARCAGGGAADERAGAGHGRAAAALGLAGALGRAAAGGAR